VTLHQATRRLGLRGGVGNAGDGNSSSEQLELSEAPNRSDWDFGYVLGSLIVRVCFVSTGIWETTWGVVDCSWVRNWLSDCLLKQWLS
jgi:hypothetical protein